MVDSMASLEHTMSRGIQGTLLAFLSRLWHGADRRYHPEQHYMRGPGPKWRAKHLAGSGHAGSRDISACPAERRRAM